MFTASTAALRNAVAIAANAVERTNTLPILGHLLCEIGPDGLTITGTDLSMTISARLEVETDPEKPFPTRFTLPADKLRGILKIARTDQVKLSVGDQRATLSAASARFTLALRPPEAYPEPPDHPRNETIVSGETLRALLEATIPAAANPGVDPRFFLCGVHLETDGTTLTAVATDGHRIHVAEAPLEASEHSLIVPKAAAAILARLIPDEDIHLHIADTDLVANLGNIRIHTKLIDARFPDWRRVVPKGENGSATAINAAAMQQAIAGCSVLSNDKYRGITLELDPDADPPGINASATNAEREHAEDTIPAKIEGGPAPIAFNADYLRQAVETATGSEIDITVANNQAATIRGAKGAGSADIYAVVMAMRI